MPHPFARRTLETLKKDAKRWLAQIAARRRRGARAPARVLPGGPPTPTLRDVQLALAREQGFDGWTALKRALEPDPARSAATLAQYDAMADALLEAYRTGTPEAMERHYRFTWHRRAWSGMRTYVQLDLGKRPSEPGGDVAITLDDARYLVAHERGFETWDALRASVAQPAGRRAAHHHRRSRPRRSGCASCSERDDTTALDLSGVRDVTDDTLEAIGRLTRLEHAQSLRHVDHRRRRRAPPRLRCPAGREPGVDLHRRWRDPRAGRQAVPAQLPSGAGGHRRRHRAAARMAGVQGVAGRRGTLRLARLGRRARTS